MAAYAEGHGHLVGNNIVNQAQGRPVRQGANIIKESAAR